MELLELLQQVKLLMVRLEFMFMVIQRITNPVVGLWEKWEKVIKLTQQRAGSTINLVL
jgi:hypothetical protein